MAGEELVIDLPDEEAIQLGFDTDGMPKVDPAIPVKTDMSKPDLVAAPVEKEPEPEVEQPEVDDKPKAPVVSNADLEAARKAAAAEAQAERDAARRELEKEREAREKAEAELKAQRDATERKAKADALAAKKAASAPDKIKLQALRSALLDRFASHAARSFSRSLAAACAESARRRRSISW
jgi:colicin import membrane protein